MNCVSHFVFVLTSIKTGLCIADLDQSYIWNLAIMLSIGIYCD